MRRSASAEGQGFTDCSSNEFGSKRANFWNAHVFRGAVFMLVVSTPIYKKSKIFNRYYCALTIRSRSRTCSLERDANGC
jgi:hypothetical protein